MRRNLIRLVAWLAKKAIRAGVFTLAALPRCGTVRRVPPCEFVEHECAVHKHHTGEHICECGGTWE